MGSVIDSARLLKDLQKQVAEAEKDLHSQLGKLPETEQRLLEEHNAAFRARRTSAAASQWISERVTQAAVAWILGTVFVRFCEDNDLLRHPFLAGPVPGRQTYAEERHDQFMTQDPSHTHRDWLLSAFDEIGSSPAGQMLFDEGHNPLYQIPLSNEGAKKIIDFWRRHEEVPESGTRIVHHFNDPDWSTRFLGDIYQDLSQEAKDKYALLQTPEFVEEFILERTLGRAIKRVGYDVVKMIDPTCGSGHFILGAFHRILTEWENRAPSDDVHVRVAGALNAVHGVDINPFAVAIARFRLLIAAFKAAGVSTLLEAASYDWPLHIATGDALLKTEQGKLFESDGASHAQEDHEFWFDTEDLAEHLDILKPGRYHVVVGNPPYIAVKDSRLRDTYRRLYRNVCHGKYVLSVPFMQRFFELAVRDEEGNVESGYVGQITSNSFMKREFGEKMVQGYLRSSVDLIEVIDSSGAYIPGHGTPTVILVGRNRPASLGAKTVRAVRGVQGEPTSPRDPRLGLVWRDIVERVDAPGKSAGAWVSADNLDRGDYFGKHPWVLADGGVETLLEINKKSVGELKKYLKAVVGIAAVTGEDDLYVLPRNGTSRRLGVWQAKPLITGESVRDHLAIPEFDAIWTYGEDFAVIPLSDLEGTARILHEGKSVIRRRKRFGKPMVDRGFAWYEWQEIYSAKLKLPLTITFAEVATHNHFALDRGGKIFNRTAPVIKLPENSTEDDYLQLLGLLNSSMACFWLKQMCHSKGSTVDVKGARQSRVPFDDFYQFNGTNVQEFPLPAEFPLVRATELDTLAQQLAAVTPSVIAADPEKSLTAEALAQAKSEWHRIRARMIAVQEELDWEVYSIYGLHGDLTAPEDSLPVNGVALGHRAFEIDLGKRVKEQGVKTEWFRRHNSTMICEIPAEWPEAYKETVRRRLEAMKNSSVIGLIERPEYKRRWLTDSWEDQQQAALKEWLLARMERRELWYETDYDGTERPRTRSLPELVDDLTRDHDFVAVAELYAPGEELSVIVPKLVEDQHVPFLAALRYTEAAHKKKREVWEQVWERQREEDAATAAGDHRKAMEIRDGTPVPPKYTTADFRKASYAAQRGGLDVPKERFISYSRTLNPAIEVLGWGGWDHLEQATALTETIDARANSGNWEREDFLPYLAGLLELLPWLRQWNPEDAGMFEEALLDWQREEEFAVTDEELRAWRPARKAAKKATVKPADGKSAKKNTQAKE
ncbi:BREX-2 system adenine-specific DNA-methyltransferase PglX [Streptomyces sp. SMS_SU21]|uniref:BREX-2 system adenine-specific DNA-methyltransferase PglX n=1 Tax=Streptomyces sp. SMS_SU21 TaxID=2069440 RepID=UPI0027DF123B|nr:BREX-2 system adenine-specific DNA-methyltransferase PglX [Streptomyces sp. SMS_SU21]